MLPFLAPIPSHLLFRSLPPQPPDCGIGHADDVFYVASERASPFELSEESIAQRPSAVSLAIAIDVNREVIDRCTKESAP
jgi:hypothetical protein